MQERARELPVRERDGPVELLSDIFDADFIYNHEELGWQAEDDGSTRFAFGLYYDGVNADPSTRLALSPVLTRSVCFTCRYTTCRRTKGNNKHTRF